MRNRCLSRRNGSWLDFIERKIKFEATVIRIQALFRRRGPMKYLRWLRERLGKQPAAAVKIQQFWRRRRERMAINRFMRLKRLIQYKVRATGCGSSFAFQ